MKRILFLGALYLIFSSSVGYAQIRLGVRGGVNISNVSDTKIADLGTENVTGFYAGPTLEAMLLGRLGLETGIFYMQKGIHFKGNEDEKTEYLEVPLSLKLGFPVTKFFKPYVMAGPYANLKISGNDNIIAIYDHVESAWETKSFSAGLNFGAGVELLKFVQVGVNYGLGLTDNYKASEGSYSVKSRTWSATVAIYL